MNYPSNIKKAYTKIINYKNRGMDLEGLINEANTYYLQNDIAIIYKKPTPIQLVDVDYQKMMITKAFFKEPSTLDYNGIYLGKYIEFDAKECKSSASFPLKNIHSHQFSHINRIIAHQGIAFLIISMNNCFYLLKGEDLNDFINKNERKSIPFHELEKLGYKIEYKYHIGLDYIEALKKAYNKELIINEIKENNN